MATKQTSIFVPFLFTFTGSLVIGLCILYFGYYQTRINACNDFIVELNEKPTADVNLSFTVDDSGVTRGKQIKNPAKPVKPDKSKKQKSKAGTSHIEDNKSINNKSAAKTRKSSKASKKKNAKPSRKLRTRVGQTSKESDSIPSKPVKRGPAFPSSRTSSETDDDFENNSMDNEPMDINDPEMDDNPLIKALREASQKQQDNPRPSRDSKPKNPFEAIFNSQNK